MTSINAIRLGNPRPSLLNLYFTILLESEQVGIKFYTKSIGLSINPSQIWSQL